MPEPEPNQNSANISQSPSHADEAKAKQEAEVLLKMLDLQMEQSRAKRQLSRGRRNAFRAMGLLFFVLAALLILFITQYFLSEVSRTKNEGNTRPSNERQKPPSVRD